MNRMDGPGYTFVSDAQSGGGMRWSLRPACDI